MAEVETQAQTVPRRVVHEEYQKSVQARRDWITVTTMDTDALHSRAHEQLQRTTLQYFETLKYELQTKDAVRPYWEGQPPEDDETPLDEGVAFIILNSDQFVAADEKAVRSEMERYPGHARKKLLGTKNGLSIVGVVWGSYGLQLLDRQWEQTTTETTEKAGLRGIRVQKTEKPALLPPDALMRAATTLDMAADELGIMLAVDERRSLYHAGGEDEYPEPHGNAQPPE